MSYRLVPRGTLVGLAVVSLAAFALAERSQTQVHTANYRLKVQAVETMIRAERALYAAREAAGLPIDQANDPSSSGIIGPEFSLITTDRGAHAAKLLAADPNFAAAVLEMLRRAGLRRGDVLAVGVTGSLPGLNLAVYSACRTLELKPIIIS